MRHVLLCLVVLPFTAAAEFKRLHSDQATASSFLESNWNKYQENYHPTYVLDDDPKTAWVEGAEGDGVGESLTVRVSSLRQARAVRLVLTPGYQKSKDLFAANGFPTKVELVVRDATDGVTAKQDLTLAPKWGPQTFDVPVKGGVASMTLTLREVKPGTKYKDTCVSDLQLFVDSDVPYDARVEEARRTAMLAWKKERLDTAKYFSTLPKEYPWSSASFTPRDLPGRLVLPRFVAKKENPDFLELGVWLERNPLPAEFDAEATAALKELRALVKYSKGGAWFSVTAKSTVAPDGLRDSGLPRELLSLVRNSDLTLFEARGELEVTLRSSKLPGQDWVSRRVGLSSMKLLEGKPTAPKKLFGKLMEVTYERSDYETTTWVLASWGDDGLLRRLTLWREADEVSGGGRMREEGASLADDPEVRRHVEDAVLVWAFDVTNGKLSSATQTVLASNPPEEDSEPQADDGLRFYGTRYGTRAKK